MKQATLEGIAPLLEVLRANDALREVRPAVFYLEGREFLHFHEGPNGVAADVLLAKGRVSMPVSSPPEQAELLERIRHHLQVLGSRARDRARRGRQRHRG